MKHNELVEFLSIL